MSLNLTETNKDYSIFLPSISSFYSKFVSGYNQGSVDNGPRQGKLPANLPTYEHFNFLNKDKGVFTYDHALYSAGHAQLDLTKTDVIESMVTKRDRDNTWILGDSGGYQIASGILDFDWDDIKSQNADQIRGKIQKWLEHTSDYAMLFDFPTRAIDNERASLNSFKDCLDGSLINFDYFRDNRKGDTKYLNVLQGRNITEANIWFDAVKDYPFEGWAFGGFTMMDFEMILYRIINMRDNHYFEENSQGDKRNWLHFLGQSRMTAACAFTHIQRLLRKQVDDDIRISYDSASAFLSVAHGQVYTNDTYDKKKFSYIMDTMYDDKRLVGSDLPFPWRSEIGDRITMGDISVKSDAWYVAQGKDPSKTSWDSLSYFIMMGHNVERHIRAIQQANKIYDLSDYSRADYMPLQLVEFKEVVEEVFNSETPYDVITKHQKLLNNLVGRRTGKGLSVSDSVMADLFDVQEHEPSLDDNEFAYKAIDV